MVDSIMKSCLKQMGNFDCIPKKFLTYELCLMSVSNSTYSVYNNFRAIPVEFLSSSDGYKICFEAVRHSDRILQFVPIEYLTYDLCLEAVKLDGIALQYVPIEHRTSALCLEAVNQDIGAIYYMPEKHTITA